jgi:hypothetical protein
MESWKIWRMTTNMTNENGTWYNGRKECLIVSYVHICTHQFKTYLFNGTGFLLWSAYFSAVYAFDYNHWNDLQSLQMVQGMTVVWGSEHQMVKHAFCEN